MDHLFAAWRSAYVGASGAEVATDATADRCVFCRIFASEESDEERFIVHEGSTMSVILNLYPYTSGHLMVMPRRHVHQLEDLTAEEATEMWGTVHRAVSVLKLAYEPDGLNVGLNLGRAAGAGIPGHLHVHAVPRWVGDSNFMTSVASARILPESLPETWKRMREAWAA